MGSSALRKAARIGMPTFRWYSRVKPKGRPYTWGSWQGLITTSWD